MKSRESWSARLRYGFDKSMAGGAIALIGWLALISLVVIILAGALLAITGIAPQGGEPMGFVEGAWESLMRTMDAGTMGSDLGWSFRGVSLLVTIAGIFVFSALIGVISSGLEDKLDDLRKGRSRVLETEHTIILNWSPSIFDVISELVIANQSRRNPRIVIMANKDKVEMEDEIATKVPDRKNTRIICRSGDPTDLYDLGIVNPQTSRSIIVLSPAGDDADPQVIKTVLALVNDPNRRPEKYMIAAEIRNADNAEVARIVGGGEMQLVLADDLIARIVVHTSRQAGLSAVYSELLDFDGCEIYTLEQPDLVGKSFGNAVLAYDNSTLIGLCDKDGAIRLNPNPNQVIVAGDRVVIIAEDDDSIKTWSGDMDIDKSAIKAIVKRGKTAERTLILGWNRRGPIIATEARPLRGARLAVDDRRRHAGIRRRHRRTQPRQGPACRRSPGHRHCQPLCARCTRYPVLRPRPGSRLQRQHDGAIGRYPHADHPAAASQDRRKGRQACQRRQRDDRRAQPRAGGSHPRRGFRRQQQAGQPDARPGIGKRSMAAIFDELLDEAGSEIYMRPMSDYVDISKPVNFFTVALAALRRGEIAIGHRRQRTGDADVRNLGGVVVNPLRTEMTTYAESDMLIVLAAD